MSSGKTKASDAFRESEKFYKFYSEPKSRRERRANIQRTKNSFEDVINFSKLKPEDYAPGNSRGIFKVPIPQSSITASTYFDVTKIEMYGLRDHPGFYFIPNPFTPAQQRYWISRCVRDFPINNPTNVSSLRKLKQPKEEADFPESHYRFKEITHDLKDHIRWVNMGYHFQWTEREYNREKRGEMPQDLSDLAKQFATFVPKESLESTSPYIPQAITVNYYTSRKHVMGGHQDNSEEDLSQPIVSCSFGGTVIFLLGSESKKTKPTAFFISSGDTVIMAGSSRRCFHGVARIMENSVPSYLNEQESPKEWKDCAKWMEGDAVRFNINVRQVWENSTTF